MSESLGVGAHQLRQLRELAAMRLASLRVSKCAADRRPGSSSKYMQASA